MDNTELRLIPIQINKDFNYYADSNGNIWRQLKGRPRRKKELNYTSPLKEIDNKWYKLLKPSIGGKLKNYLKISGDNKVFSVHRLVLLAFEFRQDYQEYQINHKNRNTFDNRPENLEWVTNKENSIHRTQTSLPKSYNELREDWKQQINELNTFIDTYIPKSIGSSLIYDLEAIKNYLTNTDLSMQEIAVKTNSSLRSVRYWQEKLKIKRPKTTLIDKILPIIKENPDITPNKIASILNVRVTSIHAVLRKVKRND
jgi:hypothetical protein